jgi:hypothetical protein
MPELLSAAVETAGSPVGEVNVSLSHELVHLLSEQLYQSPTKAIEELVVNGYDAGAHDCRVLIPVPNVEPQGIVAVYDDGFGMDRQGMSDLWQIGRSSKRLEEIEKRVKRKVIGKFGIGKLATYAIANVLTYVSKTKEGILSVSVRFSDFKSAPRGPESPLKLPITEVVSQKLSAIPKFAEVCDALNVKTSSLFTSAARSWTICILEELKPKCEALKPVHLARVLASAMPIRPDFELALNKKKVVPTKEKFKKVVEFGVHQLPAVRLKSLEKATDEKWMVKGKSLVSASFPQGVRGDVVVTQESLLGGKSEDLMRSHGFFIRVRGRLLNEVDPLFGLKPISYSTFNRFRADLDVDDLNPAITAPREGAETSDLTRRLRLLLNEIALEAREQYEEYEAEQARKEANKKEHDRNFVVPRLVEHTVADVLATQGEGGDGSEADESWFYLKVQPGADVGQLAKSLYEQPRTKYKYKYVAGGRTGRLVTFNPSDFVFQVNQDHELVRAHVDDMEARMLLEDFVTAEALLEIYLREQHIPGHTVGDILEKRDTLLRSLSKDHPFSLRAIAQLIRDSPEDERDLEMALVAAARGLGFVATHISGAGEPDGLARFTDYSQGERKVILEAKSSAGIPSLAALDLAGIHEHAKNRKADGALLVAPGYPGAARRGESAVSKRANELHISCWTIEDLARVVEAAEARHITTQQVLEIVLKKFAPEDVSAAVNDLFAAPSWDARDLYCAVVDALKGLEGRLKDAVRTVELVAGEVSRVEQFKDVSRSEVEKALRELAHASQGGMVLMDSRIIIHSSLEELARRVRGLTRSRGSPRRRGSFRGFEEG